MAGELVSPKTGIRLSLALVKGTIVAALGGLLFGFDTAVIAGTTAGLTHAFTLSPYGLGFTVAIALIGTIIGSMTAGIPGNRYGRRASLRIMAVLYLASALGCALAWNWASLLFFRLIGGLGIGGSSVLGPMYIAEISPARWRGRLVGFFQLNVVVGILLAYLSNYCVGAFIGGEDEWRWMLGMSGLPALLFLLMLFFIPESPRWLVQKARNSEARATLEQIGEQDIDAELASIVKSVDVEHGHGRDALFQWKYRVPIFLAVSIAMFNQLSGINAVLYYLNDIFAKAGFSRVSGDRQAVLIGFTNLLFTILAMSLIDRFGRRTLLLIGSVVTAGCLAGVAAVFLTGRFEASLVWLLVGFIGFFGFSQGAVIWVYISEVFPTRVRASGQSLGSFTHWFMNGLISWSFPVVASHSRGAPFVFFAIMMVVQFFVVLFAYPETKGVALEEMEQKLQLS
jgi:MFS transporter, SP family, arabinose:H+ symporter